jgi:hypothetical protein
MQTRERIIVFEDGADLLREAVLREPAPSTELVEWRGCGAERGEYEAREVSVEYLAPSARGA